jgi:protoporphyrinogen oxidase
MHVNVARLTRSLRKWRRHFGCDLTERTLERFTREALAMSAEAMSAEAMSAEAMSADVRPRPDSHQ